MLPPDATEDSVRRIISDYRIGDKLRRLRLKKKFSLTELGQRVGLSASLLSQLESGKMIPTLPTLMRISEMFGISLSYFFTKDTAQKFSIVRSQERIRFPESTEKQRPSYFFETLAFKATDKAIYPYLAEFPLLPGTEITEHHHSGSELLYVIEGSLLILHDGDEHILHSGDTAYFDPLALHSYRGLSASPAKALVVIYPSMVFDWEFTVRNPGVPR